MSDFASERGTLDMGELDIRKTTTPELIVVNRRAFEATTSIGKNLSYCLSLIELS
jgi:hypothetical protein